MGKTLFVILGAGASYDCHAPSFTSAGKLTHRPPLTKDLFTPPHLEHIRAEYPEITGPATDFTSRVRQNGNETIEQFLRRLRDDPNPLIQKQYRMFCLYLQHLFEEISLKHLSYGEPNATAQAPNAYTLLIQRIHNAFLSSKYDKVCMISFNYDTLLDKAISDYFSIRFDHLARYLNFTDGWSYVKFHGSHDWWLRFPSKGSFASRGIRADTKSWLSTHPLIAGGELTILPSLTGHGAMQPAGNYYFPAIAAPVDDKYEPLCPESHVEHLKKLAADETCSKDMLIVGFSGIDNDLYSCVEAVKNVYNVMVVCESRESCQRTLNNFFRGWAKSLESANPHFWDSGFATFSDELTGLQSFISN